MIPKCSIVQRSAIPSTSYSFMMEAQRTRTKECAKLNRETISVAFFVFLDYCWCINFFHLTKTDGRVIGEASRERQRAYTKTKQRIPGFSSIPVHKLLDWNPTPMTPYEGCPTTHMKLLWGCQRLGDSRVELIKDILPRYRLSMSAS